MTVVVGVAMIAAAGAFSAVTTPDLARRAERAGQLVRIHIFPRALGGEDVAANVTWVTPAAAAEHARLTNRIAADLRAGRLAGSMDVAPDYRGDSIVPTRIVMTVGTARGGVRTYEIAVW